LRMVVIFLFKEPHFYVDGLQVTTRCAIRGFLQCIRECGHFHSSLFRVLLRFSDPERNIFSGDTAQFQCLISLRIAWAMDKRASRCSNTG
jgi:hypothetical protein